MKANKEQIDLCETLRSIISFWETSNDITSPNHFTIIEEEIRSQLDNYDEVLANEIIDRMQDLYRFVKSSQKYIYNN